MHSSVKHFKKLFRINGERDPVVKSYNRPVVIIYVIGGLTYAEIGYLR